MEYYVYVLKNDFNGKIYIGYTSDLESRVDRHNGIKRSKEKSYTSKNKSEGVWILKYKEEFISRAEAMKREKELKSFQGREHIKKLMI